MKISTGHVVPVNGHPPQDISPQPSSPRNTEFANYLPDELLLEILSYLPSGSQSQKTLATFCLVSRQWYDLAIQRLYEAPYLVGKAYGLFVRTICPSVLVHIRKSELAGLVKVLNLSHIVHQGNKATTARLLNRTKPSLETFVAPQASFAVNCWAALSKCTQLRVLNLSLVSECISYQSLNQTVRQLPELLELYLPRCSSNYESMELSMNMVWPPMLRHLQLSGGVHGKFMMDLLNQPESFPKSMSSVAISHCPGIMKAEVCQFLKNISETLTHVEVRDLPKLGQGKLNSVLAWAPNLKSLVIALDYIDLSFGHMASDFDATMWERSKPLESFTLVTSGLRNIYADRLFSPTDLFTLIDERFFGRLRYVNIATSTGWARKDEAAEVEALAYALDVLDEENWDHKRWHYAEIAGMYDTMHWEAWIQTRQGKQMKPQLRLLRDQ